MTTIAQSDLPHDLPALAVNAVATALVIAGTTPAPGSVGQLRHHQQAARLVRQAIDGAEANERELAAEHLRVRVSMALRAAMGAGLPDLADSLDGLDDALAALRDVDIAKVARILISGRP